MPEAFKGSAGAIKDGVLTEWQMIHLLNWDKMVQIQSNNGCQNGAASLVMEVKTG